MENIDMWEWVQQIRCCRFDSYLIPQNISHCNTDGAAGRQSLILLLWRRLSDLVNPNVQHLLKIFLCWPVISGILCMAGNHRVIDYILVASCISPGKDQLHTHLLQSQH